ncbi:MAG: hypothetical protein JEZ06_08195 [Anaerolineaceae bacterium]|nr:hypothetical protein [Anaerolineaceae bacterium]
MKATIAVAQINTKLGRVKANLEKHMAFIKEAKKDGADLLVFPELSMTGYVLQDLVPTVAHKASELKSAFKPLLQASHDLDMVVGFVEEDIRNRFFISAAYISEGKIVHIHRKVYLPTYGLFDEGRFFAWGDSIEAFDTRFGRVGVLICEDFWHSSPPYLMWLDGADLLILTSASPGHGLGTGPILESSRWVYHINQSYASFFTSFVVHSNRVGFEDGLNFSGGSTVFDPDGNELLLAPHHEEALSMVEVDLNQLHRTRARLPLLRDERTSLVQRELNRILQKREGNSGH